MPGSHVFSTSYNWLVMSQQQYGRKSADKSKLQIFVQKSLLAFLCFFYLDIIVCFTIVAFKLKTLFSRCSSNFF